jgi:hypothetical protein
MSAEKLPSKSLFQSKSLNLSEFVVGGSWYTDSQFFSQFLRPTSSNKLRVQVYGPIGTLASVTGLKVLRWYVTRSEISKK